MTAAVTAAGEHVQRRRDIIKAHPEVLQLRGPYQPSALWIVVFVTVHTTVAILLQKSTVWLIIPIAYFIGAFISHALWVLIHETCHNLVCGSTTANKLLSIIANMPHIFPSAIAFRHYHLWHHSRLGCGEFDMDVPTDFEINHFSRHWVLRLAWIAIYQLWIMIRSLMPIHATLPPPPKLWLAINAFCNISYFSYILYVTSWRSMLYLVLSLNFSLSLHIVGARWIAEHFELKGSSGQETFSYYGPINYVAFFVGYHTEHHDFPNVAWRNLPVLTKMAPEFYLTRQYYSSYTDVLIRFIFGTPPAPYANMLEARRKQIQRR